MRVETLQRPREVNTPVKSGGVDLALEMLDSMIRDSIAESKATVGDGRERAVARATAQAYETCKTLILTHCR